MGKYSKALEKAKDKSIQHADQSLDVTAEQPVQNEAIEEKPVQVVVETKSDQIPKVDSAESQPEELQESNIPESCNNMEDWDEKLLEIISGNSKQVSESIRMLRTKIFHPDQGKPPKTILVTSSVPGEGKSFVCANLGVSIAQGIEQKALLIDCDMRKPRLNRVFGM